MTLSEATRQGIELLTRPEWSWTSYIKLYLTERDGKHYHGPWVDMVTLPLEPEKVLWTELPGDGWEEYMENPPKEGEA